VVAVTTPAGTQANAQWISSPDALDRGVMREPGAWPRYSLWSVPAPGDGISLTSAYYYAGSSTVSTWGKHWGLLRFNPKPCGAIVPEYHRRYLRVLLAYRHLLSLDGGARGDNISGWPTLGRHL
jgi:hypothetical protein